MKHNSMALGCNPSMLRSTPSDCEVDACTRESSLLETVGMTAERLHMIESGLQRLEGVLFGFKPCDPSKVSQSEPSVLDRAQDAFNTTIRIERLVDDLIYRTEAN